MARRGPPGERGGAPPDAVMTARGATDDPPPLDVAAEAGALLLVHIANGMVVGLFLFGLIASTSAG